MKKLLSIILTAVMVMALAVPVFAADPEVISVETGSATNDVEVGYTYIAGTDTAAKHFYVTLAFTLPTTLEYKGGAAAYKWNPETGAYAADTDNDVAGEGSLANDGAFSIVITNQSNVGIDYTVEYTADANAIFATAAAEDWTNDEGTVDTIAKGQEIGEDGITITNVTDATTGNTEFNSATCTGSITVTGLNSTPAAASGTDKLGTFTVTIGEAVAEEEEEEETEPVAWEATFYNLMGEGKTFTDNEWNVRFTPTDGYSGYNVSFENNEGVQYNSHDVVDTGLAAIDEDSYSYDCGLCCIQFELEDTECKKIILTGELEDLFHDNSVGSSITLYFIG